MFPSPIGTHRGVPGSLSGSLSTPVEKSDGLFAIQTQPSILNSDASDVQEWEFFSGSWAASSLATILSTTYSTGKQVRTRLSNSYFGSTTAYVTSSASEDERVGGIGSTLYTGGNLPSYFALASYVGATYVTFEVNVPKQLVNSANIYGKDMTIYVALIDGTQQNISYEFERWPDDSLGSFTESGVVVTTTSISGAGDYYKIKIEVPYPNAPSAYVQLQVDFRAQYYDSTTDPATMTRFTANHNY